MSMLNNPPHTISFKRNQQIEGTNKRALTTVAGPIGCFIQPMSSEQAAGYGMAVANAFNCFTKESVDIRVGDQAVDGKGVAYGVSGVTYLDYGNNPHYEIVLNKEVK
jgi:hypothetical protein